MAFRSGLVSNSHQLTQIIHAAMREAGWELRSGIDPDGINSVFYSSGEDGNQDIFLRVAANQSDIVLTGDVQFASDDGYTGFVNFFAYQFFPQDGAESSGLNEIGRYGPIMYLMDDPVSNSNYKVEEYNMYSSTASSGTQRIIAQSTAYVNTGDLGSTFDGHRFFYIKSTGSSLASLDVSREDGAVTYSTKSSTFFTNVASDGTNTVLSRKSNTEPLIWAVKNGTNAGMATYNTLTGESIDVAVPASEYPEPPWGTVTAGGGGWAVQSARRNGKKYIYAARGELTNKWSRFDVDDNTWVQISPWLPYNINNGSQAIIVPKEGSGNDTDRMYMLRGDNAKNFSSIIIGDDGLPSGVFFGHAICPFSISTLAGDRLLYVGGDRIFLIRRESTDLHYWKFPATDTDDGVWVTISGWFAEINESKTTLGAHNHLGSRTKIDELEGSKYWVMADKNRVIVATQTEESKLTDDYHLCYAGLFDSFSNSTDVATLAAAASLGATTIAVTDASIFNIGAQYRLAQIDDSATVMHTAFNGEMRNTAHAEIVTISSVQQHSVSPAEITISSPLKNAYTAGAKMAEDLQPVCLSVDGMNRVSSINNINTNDDDINNDVPYQWYTYKKPQIDTQTRSERIGGTNAWPVLLSHSGAADSLTVTSKDARGKLNGVYFVHTTIDNESTIEIDDKRYLVISVFNSLLLTKIAIGPLE